MPSSYDEKIDNVLADSELARRLVPNKFKFTSQQGRKRRQKLLVTLKNYQQLVRLPKLPLPMCVIKPAFHVLQRITSSPMCRRFFWHCVF